MSYRRYVSGILVLASVFTILYFGWQWQNPLKVPIVKSIRLLDITNANCSTEFVCPQGMNFFLVLGTPRTNVSANGRTVLYKDGLELSRFTIEPQALTSVNLLERQALDSYIISIAGLSNKWELNKFLTGGQRYQITAEISPNGGSLWLFAKYPSGWDAPFGIGKRHKTIAQP